MKTKKLLFSLCLAMLAPHAFATGEAEQASKDKAESTVMSASETPKKEKKKSRFTIGGYGEAVYRTFIATAIYVIAARIDIKTKHTDASTFLMSY